MEGRWGEVCAPPFPFLQHSVRCACSEISRVEYDLVWRRSLSWPQVMYTCTCGHTHTHTHMHTHTHTHMHTHTRTHTHAHTHTRTHTRAHTHTRTHVQCEGVDRLDVVSIINYVGMAWMLLSVCFNTSVYLPSDNSCLWREETKSSLRNHFFFYSSFASLSNVFFTSPFPSVWWKHLAKRNENTQERWLYSTLQSACHASFRGIILQVHCI